MEDRRISGAFPDALVPLLRRMGEDLAVARKARRLTQDDLASRMNVARKTVINMEKGDPRVSFGAYAVAGWIMGLEQNLLSAFDPGNDPVFQREARLAQPKRVRADTGNDFGDLDF
ncbi:helix-turn-helix transcriptional regulator [Defluviimonas salinarum]|uniref:HTH cro/C1-type domain-containing protein n=1 Tax=Defluviimonas salinarum TaxID=2992147 RepID=A0ABT3J7C7_9RHOB|nr:helix-turn-helix domain-containing protein [Defluviimonas salinarum]MCW3783569.1 hypothetical protein [Defluviimonas salinarum]